MQFTGFRCARSGKDKSPYLSAAPDPIVFVFLVLLLVFFLCAVVTTVWIAPCPSASLFKPGVSGFSTTEVRVQLLLVLNI